MIKQYKLHLTDAGRNIKIFIFANFLQNLGLSVYALLFNLYLKEKGYGDDVVGMIISAAPLGTAIMCLPISFLIEKMYPKYLFIIGVVGTLLGYFYQLQGDTKTELYTGSLISAMFLALFTISVSPFLMRNTPKGGRFHIFSLNGAMTIAGQFSGFLIGGYLPALMMIYFPHLTLMKSYRYAITVALIFTLAAPLTYLFLKLAPIPKVKKGWKRRLFEHDWKMISKLVFPKIFFALGAGMILPFMNIYLRDEFQLSADLIGWIFAILQLFIFFGMMITPQLMKRMTSLQFISITTLLSLPFMFLMGFTSNLVIVMACFFLRGMLMNMNSPIFSIFEMEKVKESETTFVAALLWTGYNLAWTVSTYVGGKVIAEQGYRSSFVIAVICYLIAILGYRKLFCKAEVVESR